MTWDQLHLMITRSTTPELILFYYRLTSFISSQSKVFKKEKQFFNQTDENDENEKKMSKNFILLKPQNPFEI
jgi:hypothetical protein